jgi:penicillin-binding protein A
LALVQLKIAVLDAPRLASDARNPRRADIVVGRGTIFARDGSVLAESRAGRRVYPLGSDAAHVVGYASPRFGTFGLEDAFDRVLSSHGGSGVLHEIRSFATGGLARGNDIVTTIDPAVQRRLADLLVPQARGAGVVLDPRTGAVLALASSPAFDPNDLVQSWEALRANPDSPLLDRAIDGLYPPGSTFKIVTASDGLEAGTITPTSRFTDDGALSVGNFVVQNDRNERTGNQDLAGAFALSSNVDFAQIALDVGADRWFDDASRWGLGHSLDFDLPSTNDRIPSRDEVTPSVLAQLGFGQASLLVTPLRMAMIAATIADGGTMPRPYLVRSIAGTDTGIATKPEQLAHPITPATAATIRDLMLAVVQRGTGTSAALAGVNVAGKTGTATNPHGLAHSWFLAFAPAEAPRVVVAVVIENAGYGATVAAPIVREVLRVALDRTRT